MKHISRLSILFVTLFVMAPAPANACIAILAPVCDMITGGNILKAVTGRVNAYVSTLLSEIEMKQGQKLAEASDANATIASKQEMHANAEREMPGPAGSSCAIATLGQDYIRGGRANQPSVDNTQPFGGTGASTGASVVTRPFTMPSTRSASGGYVPNGTAITATDSSAVDFDVYTKKSVEDQAVTDQMRRDNTLKGSENHLVDAKSQFDLHNKYFGQAALTADDKLFFNADINVRTIFANDTFPATVDKVTSSVTLKDAADRFCLNVAEPAVLPPNRGQVKADSIDRQLYSNQRAGWDARLSLAKTICDEAVARRIGKDVSQVEKQAGDNSTPANGSTPGDWFVSTVNEYRMLACGLGSANTSPTAEQTACGAAVNAYAGSGKAIKISEHEMAKTIYTRMLFTPNASKLLGAANETDVKRMMLQLDQLQVMLNYRIYEMQEKLALIKAAQLATMVEGGRSNPLVGAPGQ